MRRVWPLLALGASAYLLFLVVSFPAARMTPWLERQVSGLSLHGVAGSLVSGQAIQLVYRGLDLGRVSWRARPLALLLGRLEYHLELSDPVNPGQARLAITPGGAVRGRDIRFTVSPDRLAALYSPLPVTTSGRLRVEIETLDVSAAFPEHVAGRLDWEAAAVLSPVELVLGDIAMALHSEPDALVGDMVSGGRLEAAGGVQLTADGRYRYELRIRPDNQTSEDTLAMLETVGRMQPDGQMVFTGSGRW